MRLALAAAAMLVSAPALAQSAGSGSIKPDGTVVVPSFELPPSVYLSPEALKALPRTPTDMEAPMMAALAKGQVPQLRARIGEFMKPRHDAGKARYGVTTRAGDIAGIPVVYATPTAPVPKANAPKILLNLPGGGFFMGTADGTGSIESIPLAGLAKVQVVSMTYRQAPENKHPAALEDVAKVYRELLKTHKPRDIAIFGCSAGGLLTAEAMAYFQQQKIPLPGAIGIFCASADGRWGGDSRAYSRPFQALPGQGPRLGYFEGIDMTDPVVSPVLAPAMLKRFPPTLLITATRAMEMSAAVNSHRELVKAGVDAELHVWDGLGHAFFYDYTIPESREAFEEMAGFFRKHLGLAK